MKVIQVDTGKEWRGGQSQVLLMAEGMREMGIDVLIAARRGSALAQRAAERRLNRREIPFRFEVDPGSALQLARLSDGEGAPSLIHAQTPHALGLALLARSFGAECPIVFTRRVVFPLKKLFITRWKLNRADCIVAVSETVAAELTKAGIAKEKIRVIPDGIDSRIFSYRGPNFEEPLNLVISGAIEAAKGIRDAKLFVEKAAHLPFRFHFIGTGSELQQLQAWAAGRSNVVVHGFVRDVASFLGKMFGSLSFSPSEGLPNAMLEAMAVGLPVLVRENPAVREIVTGGSCGEIFDSLDQAMDKISAWVSNKHAVSESVRRTSEWVLSNYSHTRMIERNVALYRELLASDHLVQ